ncbi:alpha/beta fold hydrolase [bacterium]|nr:alpha/beta fold hydrolase [bacterium]
MKNLRRVWRVLRWFAGVAAILVAGVVCYACAAGRMVDREIANTPRDAKTGIVLGAEPIDIDPPSGDRPTTAVLMLHGFVGSRRDFADLGVRLAAQGYHVRLARLPGHGTTPRDFAEQTPESMLAGARAELASLRKQYKAVYVMGFSMGGAIGSILASEGDVDRLVLISPYYGVTYRWFYILPAETWNGMLGWAIPYVVKTPMFVQVNRVEAKKEIYSYHAVPTRGAATLMTLGRKARTPETLAAIKCPVLMVASEGDMASSPRWCHKAFARIGATNKHEVWFTTRSNHHLMWDYDREEAKRAIQEFVDRES